MKNIEKLNIGSGEDYKRGWINLDCRKNIKTDVKWDLNKFPYPFKDNIFKEILLKNVLEHLKEPINVLKEIIRIAKNNANIKIIVPHANHYANISDIQHKNNFTESTFSESHLKEYELENLKLIRAEFIFLDNKWKKYTPFKRILKIYFNGIYDDIFYEFEAKK